MNVRCRRYLSVVPLAVALLVAPSAAAEPDGDPEPAIPPPMMPQAAAPSPPLPFEAMLVPPPPPVAVAPPPPPAPLVPGGDAAVVRGESLLGTDKFGHYGCEAFVAYAFNVPQGKYGWDGASETMYQTLLKQGQLHTDTNPPRGALVFSHGSDGPHIDIARGDGTYLSAGVQGLSRGWGNGHDIQILPTANVGKGWQYRGWAYTFPQ